jgi:hypothetical protein
MNMGGGWQLASVELILGFSAFMKISSTHFDGGMQGWRYNKYIKGTYITSDDISREHITSGDISRKHTSGDISREHKTNGDISREHIKSGDISREHTSGDI